MFRTLLLLFFVVVSLTLTPTVYAQDTTQGESQTASSTTAETGFGVLSPSFQTTILTLLFIVALLVALYMVFFFARRLQSAAFLRSSLVDSVQRQVLQELVRELDDRVRRGPIDVNFMPPEGYNVRNLWDGPMYNNEWTTDRYAETAGNWGYSGDDPVEKEKFEREQANLKTQREERERQIRQWEQDERKRYEVEKLRLAQEAARRADEQVPKSLDVSLLGGGFSFVLEFSTVIVIIFALLVLTALRSIEGREVATILAAVAGYVLGKTTSSSADRGAANVTNPTTVTTTQPAATSSSITAGKTLPTQL